MDKNNLHIFLQEYLMQYYSISYTLKDKKEKKCLRYLHEKLNNRISHIRSMVFVRPLIIIENVCSRLKMSRSRVTVISYFNFDLKFMMHDP